MTIKRLSVALAVASALGFAQQAPAAVGVLFDLDGAGGGAATGAQTFNWIFNATLAQGLFPRGIDGMLYGQAELDTISNGASTSAPTGRFTYQFALPVSSVAASNTTVFDPTGTTFGPENYFRIYYDPTPTRDRAAGTGYGDSDGIGARNATLLSSDQILILDAKISLSASGAFFTTPSQTAFVPLGSPAAQNPRGTNTVSGSGNITLDIDVCTAAEVGTLAHPSCSVVSTFDTDFWKSEITSLKIDFDLGDGIKDPASAGVDVMQKLNNQTPDFGAGTSAAGTNNYLCDAAGQAGNLDTGTAGVTICDMYFAGTNANMTTEHVNLPEPETMLLLGLGLGALSLSSLRRRRRVA